eukprot:TRINITY_DN4928_c0_g1_i2.p1 TRINITY_DN4928_c0_g1~~TRINITY_DN4928_c0_g1_i2.p1  ORF type:complete len:267 (-),score=16.46 TRINITY_DN4928_c0_g1_i2:204-1004(-)
MFSKDVSAMTDLPSERLTAEYFNFDSSVPPVLVQDASTLFAVAQPLLFYKSSGQGRCRSNAFPGVFLPCGGYGHVPAHEDHALIDFLCKPVPSAELVTAAVKAHIAVREGDNFMLKPRASDIKDSKWSTICVETFSSSMPPLPTPACVYNQFIDTLADDLVGMTREQRLDTLQRQYAVASSLTRLVYPYFDPSCSETTKMQASNEVFYAAGFSATLGYSDPIVRIVSVCRLCATLLGILRNMRAARIGDHPAFIAACEMCFLASSN